MASSKGKKNNTTLLVVLLLLLLLAGWLIWKWTSASSKSGLQPTDTQTNVYAQPSPVVASQINAYHSLPPIPEIRFSMPEPAPPPPPAQSPSLPRQTQSASQAATAGSSRTTASSSGTTTRRPAQSTAPATSRRKSNVASSTPRVTAAASQSTASAASARELRAPRRPAQTIFSDTPVTGGPIDGYAIVRGKQQDPATGRFLLYCASEKTSLTYIYEVDAATYHEASPGLMYNPLKVEKWKFVSSQ